MVIYQTPILSVGWRWSKSSMWWVVVCKPILALSLGFGQAEQLLLVDTALLPCRTGCVKTRSILKSLYCHYLSFIAVHKAHSSVEGTLTKQILTRIT